MSTAGKVLSVLVAVILIVGLAVGGWHLGWWLKEESTNRTTSIAEDSLARQQALIEDATDKAADIRRIDVQVATATPEQSKTLEAQRIAIVDQFCFSYGGLTGRLSVPASVDALAAQECI